jgi:hypothetical protein
MTVATSALKTTVDKQNRQEILQRLFTLHKQHQAVLRKVSKLLSGECCILHLAISSSQPVTSSTSTAWMQSYNN